MFDLLALLAGGIAFAADAPEDAIHRLRVTVVDRLPRNAVLSGFEVWIDGYALEGTRGELARGWEVDAPRVSHVVEFSATIAHRGHTWSLRSSYPPETRLPDQGQQGVAIVVGLQRRTRISKQTPSLGWEEVVSRTPESTGRAHQTIPGPSAGWAPAVEPMTSILKQLD